MQIEKGIVEVVRKVDRPRRREKKQELILKSRLEMASKLTMNDLMGGSFNISDSDNVATGSILNSYSDHLNKGNRVHLKIP